MPVGVLEPCGVGEDSITLSSRAVWLSGVVWLLCLSGAAGQTISCPTRLSVTAPGLRRINTFVPGDIKVTVSLSQVQCSYSLLAALEVPAAEANDCASLGEVKASLPGAGALDAKLPEGFTPWRFSPRKAQLVFDRYLRGRCRYGPKSYSEVSLVSEIPAGHSCQVLTSSAGEFACSERQLLCGAGRLAISNFGVASCGKCAENAVSDGSQTECTVCAAGSAPNAARSACEVCGAGQIARAGRCSLCAGGSVPDASHSSCIACAEGQVAIAGSCVSCRSGMVPNMGRNACVICGGNQALDGTQCVSCASGSIPNPGHTACEPCAEDQITMGGICSTCRAGTVPNAEHSACGTCAGDQVSQGGACVSCGVGTLPNAEHSYCYVALKPPKD